MYRHNGYTNMGHDYHDVINVCILYKLSYTISGDPYMDESLTNTVSGLMQYRGFYLNDGIWLLYSRQHLGNNHSSLMHWALTSCIETFNHFSCDHLVFPAQSHKGWHAQLPCRQRCVGWNWVPVNATCSYCLERPSCWAKTAKVGCRGRF